MSLFFYRRAITRAVAGELSAPAEKRLRAHLRGCAGCRAYYDRLSTTADALTAAGAPGRIAERRARARLLAELELEPGSSAGARPRAAGSGSAARRWWPAALLFVPAAAALLLIARPADHEPAGDITWRGPATEQAAPPATLLIYASRKGAGAGGGPGPVRLVADLPASGEGRVSLSDYIQFSVRGLRTSAFTTVIGIDEDRGLHRYAPRPGAVAAPQRAGEGPVTLGPSIDLERGHRPGRLRVYALFSPRPLDEAQLRAAVERVDPTRPGVPPLDLPVPQVSGLLLVNP
jgi:hypothetical protein